MTPPTPPLRLPPPRDLIGLPVHPVTLHQATLFLERRLLAGGPPMRHVALNAAKVVACRDDSELTEAVRRAELVTADGVGVLALAKRLGQPLPERVTGIDLMEALCARAAVRGWPVYFLGAEPGVAALAAAVLSLRMPGLQIAGTADGFFAPGTEDAVAAEVAASGARLLFVGLPTPRKEFFVDRHAHAHGIPFAMGVGGAFDVLAQRVRRAPLWVQGAGFEWLWRWAQEPRRLFPRYGVDGSRFLLHLLRARR